MAQTKQYQGMLNALQNQTRNLARTQDLFRSQVSTMSGLAAETVKVRSATEQYTESIRRGDLKMGQVIKNRKLMNEVLREQWRLQKATGVMWERDAMGRVTMDMIVPRGAPAHIDNTRQKVGLYSAAVQAAAENTVKWGKNTQWAGRQLTVGFTYPLLALGAATGYAAYQVDQGLTRITKVYGDMGQATREELEQVRKDTMVTAGAIARDFGVAGTATLDLAANFAAMGKEGRALQDATRETARFAFLGDIEQDKAMQTTVALQNVFRLNTDQLRESFDYLNAVESGTVLTMQDMSEAIPRAATAIKAVGGDIKDLATLMVAMKENGVEAAQGANAIRSGFQRILNPSKAVQQQFKMITGEDLPALVERTKGELIPTLKEIGATVEGLDNVNRARVLSNLFGTYQYNRLSGALNSILNVSEQVGKVDKINAAGREAYARQAAAEAQRQRESISFRFRSTLETLKLEAAEFGEPFLEVGLVILKVVTKILEGFNDMSSGTKKALAWIAIVVAAVGPLVMLAGLMANFTGTLTKFFARIVKAATGVELLTAAQRAEQLAANNTATAYASEAQAVAHLSGQYDALLVKMRQVTGEQIRNKAMQGGYQSVPLPGGGVANWNQGRGRYYASGRPGQRSPSISNFDVADAAAVAFMSKQQVELQGELTQETDKTVAANKRGTGVMRQNAAMIAGSVAMMGMMAAGTDSWVGKLSMAVLTLSAISPLLSIVREKIAVSALATTRLATGLKTAGLFARGLLGPIGLVVGAVFAWRQMEKRRHEEMMQHLEEEMGATNSLADAIGVSLRKYNILRQNADEPITNKEAKAAKEWAEENEHIMDQLNDMNAAQVRQYAIRRGAEARLRGATAAEASRIAQTVLNAVRLAGEGNRAIRLDFDFGNVEQLARKQAAVFKESWDRFMAVNNLSLFNNTEMNDRQKAQFRNLVNGMAGVIQSAAPEIAEQTVAAAAEGFKSSRNSLRAVLTDVTSTQMAQMRDAGFKTGQDIPNFLASNQGRNVQLSAEQIEAIANLKELDAAQNNYVRSVALALGYNNQLASSMKSLNQLMTLEGKNVVSTAQAEQMYYMAIDQASRQRGALTAEEIEGIRTQYMARAGLDATSAAGEKFGRVMLEGSKKVDVAGRAIRALTGDTDALQNMTQQAMSGWQDAVLGEAARVMQVQQEGVLSNIDRMGERAARAIEREQDRMQRRFDRRADEIKSTYDKRREHVTNLIEAEEDAERRRQAIFDAEQKRLERMAQLQTRTIDFNAALAGGNLDDAAKILVQNATDISDWAREDTAAGGATASERRREELDSRMETIDAQEAAAEEALEKERRRYDKRVDAAKRANDRETENRRKAAEEQNRITEQLLQNELMAIQAYVPRTAKEREEQLRKIEEAYAKYGVNLKMKGNEWSKFVGDALKANTMAAAAEMANDKRWAAFGQAAGDAIVQGAFNMSMKQFFKWISTGTLPKNYKAPSAPKAGSMAGMSTAQVGAMNRVGAMGFHTGGILGKDQGRRTGFSGGLGREEGMFIGKKGEAVLNEKATSSLGPDAIRAMNQGKGVGGLEMPMAAGLVGMIRMAMMRAAFNAMAGMSPMTVGLQSGIFAGQKISAEQARNAGVIMSVGKSMGASQRDLVISLMTAMQESGLRNVDYGDRDSLGLFQQRPSQGWGTPAQVKNPEYAARQFFKHLLAIEDRGEMPMTLAAQAVQRSAYPYAYAKWEDLARALVSGASMSQGMAGTGQPGWQVPIRPASYTRTFAQHGNKGVDLAASVGQPIYAANGGRVITSRDIRGTNIYDNDGYASYGRYVVVDHGGVSTLYAHMSQRMAQRGQTVPAGAVLGLAGSTGNSSGPHLHFETRNAQGQFNPSAIIPGLRKGGITLNDGLAGLHKREAVLTEPLTTKFQKGVDNFANGGNTEYNVDVKLYGTNLDPDDVANAVITKLRTKERAVGRSRKVGNR